MWYNQSSPLPCAAVMLGSLLRAMLKATVSPSVSFKIDCFSRNIILLSKKLFSNSGECPEGLESFLSKDFPVLQQYAKDYQSGRLRL